MQLGFDKPQISDKETNKRREAHAKGYECAALGENGGNKEDKSVEGKVQNDDKHCSEEGILKQY